MWILIITFFFYGDPVSRAFSSSISSIQFSTEKSCNDARGAYIKEFESISDRLNKAISEEERVGELKGPNGVVISGLCVQA